MTASLRVVIAGGGTGGHLYPGLAVARELLGRHPGHVVTFAGTERGIEARVLPREGFPLDVIRSAGLKGKSLSAVLRGLTLLPLSFIDAWRIVSSRTPSVVVGVGGYSSGPVVAVAATRGVPTLLLEQNAAPGLTNRLLARLVDAAALTYEDAAPWFRGKGFVTGNPVRQGFNVRSQAEGAAGGRAARRLLVFGGSQGAHAINVAMAAAAPRFKAHLPALSIVHQTGQADLEMVRAAYQEVGLGARVEPFLLDMDTEMREADLVLCRAGATTLAELAVAGKPAVLVPLPSATDDHQRKNAEVLARAGAARLLAQRDLTDETVFALVSGLLADPTACRAMSEAALRLARPDAAQRIVDRIVALAVRKAAER
ncbi:MAG: undecaprenyldiphospho-muramoylpentapeptide beta-N-acetylglucosaminyltransferase [Vicinamibacterales bacterium]